MATVSCVSFRQHSQCVACDTWRTTASWQHKYFLPVAGLRQAVRNDELSLRAMSCNSFVENERLLVNEQGTLNDSASDEQKRAIGHSHVILNFLVNLFLADRLI